MHQVPVPDGGELKLLDFETSFGIPPPVSAQATEPTKQTAPGADRIDLKNRRGMDLDQSLPLPTRGDPYHQDINGTQHMLPSPCSTLRNSKREALTFSKEDTQGSPVPNDTFAAPIDAVHGAPQVDYFSHDWTADELISSQKSLKQPPPNRENSMAALPTERVRLTNCLWRNWWKYLRGTDSFPAHREEWQEDFDPLFLYGPTKLDSSKTSAGPSRESSGVDLKRERSILKSNDDIKQRLIMDRLGIDVSGSMSDASSSRSGSSGSASGSSDRKVGFLLA